MWGTWALAPPQLTADRSVNSSLWHINMCQYILSDLHISSFNPWNKEEILENHLISYIPDYQLSVR